MSSRALYKDKNIQSCFFIKRRATVEEGFFIIIYCWLIATNSYFFTHFIAPHFSLRKIKEEDATAPETRLF